jgi:hypothetical protein
MGFPRESLNLSGNDFYVNIYKKNLVMLNYVQLFLRKNIDINAQNIACIEK